MIKVKKKQLKPHFYEINVFKINFILGTFVNILFFSGTK